MEQKEVLQAVQNLITKFNIKNEPLGSPVEMRPLTLWLPTAYVDSYEKSQQKTKRRAGKFCKEVLKLALDLLEAELTKDQLSSETTTS